VSIEQLILVLQDFMSFPWFSHNLGELQDSIVFHWWRYVTIRESSTFIVSAVNAPSIFQRE